MTALDDSQSIPIHLRFTNLQKANLSRDSVAKPVADVSSKVLTQGSIFDAVQPDAVFIQDMSKGLADTSWERQEAVAWVSDEEDSHYIEAHLQTARLCSKKVMSSSSDNFNDISYPSRLIVPTARLSDTTVENSRHSLDSAQSTVINQHNHSKATRSELVDLLESAGLEGWIEKFEEQEIDLDCVADLTDNDLVGLGMTKIGTRRKFQRIVRQWMQQKLDVSSM